ncbi:imelysin family protein [Shimia sp.]|uniref:imelysin family protein n=1 Tax=Shimia sp. TaxID=1954381 RepID=UPI003BAD14FB
MMKPALFACALSLAMPAFAQEEIRVDQGALVDAAVSQHILPRFDHLVATTATLSEAADANCSPTSETLRAAYHAAFDAWMGVSHLRFGPTETNDRAFALAFWPDTKGFTPKALSALIADEDPVIDSESEFQTVSVAGRGFFGLEFLLYDTQLSTLGDVSYHCALVRRVASDIALQSEMILTDWSEGYAAQLTDPSEAGPYTSDAEALQVIYKALDAGLQFDSEVRLGRPLGSFDKPRPTRAEARRSGRSLRNVATSTAALGELAALLSAQSPLIAEEYTQAFALIAAQAEELQDDPVFAGVAEVQGRFRVEILQQYIDRAREITTLELGPALGVSAGFNALDGD